jgi:hypothetical protein
MAYVRMFMSALDPGDVEKVRAILERDVRPVFESFEGCLAVDLLVSSEPNAGGLVDGCVMSRWTTLDELTTALGSAPIVDATRNLRGVLRQEPVTRIYQVLD